LFFPKAETVPSLWSVTEWELPAASCIPLASPVTFVGVVRSSYPQPASTKSGQSPVIIAARVRKIFAPSGGIVPPSLISSFSLPLCAADARSQGEYPVITHSARWKVPKDAVLVIDLIDTLVLAAGAAVVPAMLPLVALTEFDELRPLSEPVWALERADLP
jgi:hypothetical protein